MDKERIKAHLNLGAVLRNLEDLVTLDDEAAQLAHAWSLCIQFSVRGGPAAHVRFEGGRCTHAMGTHPSPTISLYFLSPRHLNRMFDGQANPIPLKGFGRLGFLKRDFTRLTERLAFYLKPCATAPMNGRSIAIQTTLTLHTAMQATKILAEMDPVCRQVAARIPNGTLLVEVPPDGPFATITFANSRITVAKGQVDHPTARMTIRDIETAHALFNGRLDAFEAVVEGSINLMGLLPIIDNINLIFDRIPRYLT